jgi:hypothetical protein
MNRFASSGEISPPTTLHNAAFGVVVKRAWADLIHEAHGRRKIAARGHPIPDLVQVVLQVLLARLEALPVHTGRPAVRLYPAIRLPHGLLGNIKWLCLEHELLPDQRVGSSLGQNQSAPSLHQRYPASTVLRADPSPSGALVLWASRFMPLVPVPLASPPGFPRSTPEPGLSSRHLYAGHSRRIEPMRRSMYGDCQGDR